MIKKTGFTVYGVIAYLVFLASVVYGGGFIGNFLVPKTVDSGGFVSEGIITAFAIDTVLLGVFAVQHSLMARDFFKRRWTGLVPETVERSTYVLFASLALLLVYAGWQPIDTVVWSFELPVAYVFHGLFALGGVVALVSTFLIDHFRLFGLRQVYANLRDEDVTDEVPEFQTPGLYNYVRHPMMTGILVLFWATPQMTLGHLFLASATTFYVILGVRLEERDLIDIYGEKYENYRDEVPMLLPRPF
ncbi:MAG: isoprenylcysteine carboxylmethyltransferase family protein [Halobacteria archaeon]|nr:isoprenylcysteine carboxylmethyltransferase family protein [Halobacteria archaeon]